MAITPVDVEALGRQDEEIISIDHNTPEISVENSDEAVVPINPSGDTVQTLEEEK